MPRDYEFNYRTPLKSGSRMLTKKLNLTNEYMEKRGHSITISAG
jgi:hypothetical protein